MYHSKDLLTNKQVLSVGEGLNEIHKFNKSTTGAARPSTLELEILEHNGPPNSAEFTTYREPKPTAVRQTRETHDK
jgi:hypothetical protein